MVIEAKDCHLSVVTKVFGETYWLHNLLYELQSSNPKAIIIYCDDVKVIYMFSNSLQHQCTMHIKIDLHFVRDQVAF